MTVTDAKRIMQERLKFGCTESMEAVKVMAKYHQAMAALSACTHKRRGLDSAPGKGDARCACIRRFGNDICTAVMEDYGRNQ